MKANQNNLYYDNLINNRKLKKTEIESKKRTFKVYRLSIFLGLLFTISISILNMISTSFYGALIKSKYNLSPSSVYSRHIKWIILGMFLLCSVRLIPYKVYQKKRVRSFLLFSSVSILGFIVLCRFFFPDLVPETKGAYCWISLGGLRVQPSEPIKIIFIIIIAHLLDVVTKQKKRTSEIMGMLLPVISLYILLLILQKDLGTAIHYLAIAGCMLLVAPISPFVVKWILGLIPIVYGLVVTIFYNFNFNGNYQIQRISNYVDILYKGKEPGTDIGYQINQSLIAMGHGSFWGAGYGEGVQKYNYLPEVNTDFISSSLAEEWGFITMVVILILFLFIIKFVIETAKETNNYFGKYLLIGLGSLIFTQMLMNLYVTTGLMPIIGIPLPFFSYGGSSTVTIFISLGLILKINKDIMEK